jgi:uncharacterized repeat protein (TIGR01451 family)
MNKSDRFRIGVMLGLGFFLAVGVLISLLPARAQAARLTAASGPGQVERQANPGLPLLQTSVITLSASKDNTLYESDSGALSNGMGHHFFAGKTSQPILIRRGVIAFDLSSIPSGSTIISAKLRLRMSQTALGTNQSIELHRLLDDWGEGTSDAGGLEGSGAPATANDATWKHRLCCNNTNLWATLGGEFSPTASASISVGGINFYTWGSTPQMVADVQGWVDDPDGNFGWLLQGNETVAKTAKRFDSRENPDPANRPMLIIEYSPAAQTPGLAATKTANDLTPNPGDVLTYTMVIANHGSKTITNVTVSDPLPAGLSFLGPISLTPPQGGATLGPPPALASGLTVTAGTAITLTFPVTVDPALLPGTEITNSATVTSPTAPAPASGSVKVTVTSASVPDLSLSKTVNQAMPKPGDQISYTIVIANKGGAASDAVVSDPLPAGLQFVGPVSLTPPQGGVTLGTPPTLASGLDIGANSAVTLTFPVMVNPGLAAGTQITNTASVTSVEDPLPASDSAAVTVSAVASGDVFLPLLVKLPGTAPDLAGSFRLTPNKNSFSAGEPVQITVVITNQGTAPADAFWVDFFINPNPPPSAANTIWSNVCGLSPCYGLAWFVATNLAPGQSITLTSHPSSFSADHSNWAGFFASGTSDLYLYVDSWNPGVASGGVAESNENNNRAERHGLMVSGPNPAATGLALPAAVRLRPGPPER